MIRNAMILVLSVGLYATGQTAKATSKAGAKSAVQQGVQLPADAEKIREGVWKAKDKDGKVWFYSKTPFGYGRSADEPSASGATSASSESPFKVVAIRGDVVEFSKPTPFGAAKWTKKMEDLSDEEKQAVEKAKAKETGKE